MYCPVGLQAFIVPKELDMTWEAVRRELMGLIQATHLSLSADNVTLAITAHPEMAQLSLDHARKDITVHMETPLHNRSYSLQVTRHLHCYAPTFSSHLWTAECNNVIISLPDRGNRITRSNGAFSCQRSYIEMVDRFACFSPGEGGPCPAGYYCPLATVEPLPCPRGTFSNLTKMVSQVTVAQ